jgi:hypothetical protein
VAEGELGTGIWIPGVEVEDDDDDDETEPEEDTEHSQEVEEQESEDWEESSVQIGVSRFAFLDVE